MKKKLNKGFTLIELIVVMVLLGILAAVAIPRISNSIRDAEEKSEMKFIANLKSALELYAADNFVEESVMKYPDNPFDALKEAPYFDDETGKGWSFDGYQITHTRNDEHDYVVWFYNVYAPNSNDCGYDADGDPIQSGCYEIDGPHSGS